MEVFKCVCKFNDAPPIKRWGPVDLLLSMGQGCDSLGMPDFGGSFIKAVRTLPALSHLGMCFWRPEPLQGLLPPWRCHAGETRETHTGKALWWQSRDWSHAAPSHGPPRMAGNYEELGRVQEGPSIETLARAGPCLHLDFGLLAAGTTREYISVVYSHPVGGSLLRWPRGTNTHQDPLAFWPPEGAHTDLTLIIYLDLGRLRQEQQALEGLVKDSFCVHVRPSTQIPRGQRESGLGWPGCLHVRTHF